MSKRRLVQVGGDDSDSSVPLLLRPRLSNDEDADDDVKNTPNDEHSGVEGEEEEVADAVPLGEVLRLSGKGIQRRSHYTEFHYDGQHYHLEDSVLFTPEEETQRPYVAIIKDISVDQKGSVNVVGQWFYRPEETEKRGGGYWQSNDSRELFYSFHRDEVPAESVMHKCVVHFIPSNKQIPHRREHPGFIVQKVYDTERRRVFKLTDQDYVDDKQEEIDFLVQKTMSQLGDLPNIEPDAAAVDHYGGLISEQLLREIQMALMDVSGEEEGVSKFTQSLNRQTPGSCSSAKSIYFATLSKFNVLTDSSHRNKWLERLLQVIHAVCTSADGQTDGKENNRNDVRSPDTSGSTQLGITLEDKSKDLVSFCWPDRAVLAVASLENAVHESLSDYQKYNQKMRQMTYNLKPNALLSQRFLNGELKPSQILNMTPNELKEGLLAKEIESTQPEETQHLQMTDARCNRCSKKEVGLRDIIQAGRGDRYQLECANCGNTWYASRDQAAILTPGGSSGPTSVSTAPSATARFEDVEKVTSKTEKPAVDVLKKTPETFVAVLEKQRLCSEDKTVANVCATHSA